MQFSLPESRLRLGFLGAGGADERHLSVDGMTPAGPNLSHWPGNRTPPQWKADLSTGIALRYARAPEAEREAFLDGVDVVLNDHYDTDGFGSLLAVLRPEVAFAREELLLAAAGVGDFASWHTWRGFAIDRIVKRLTDPASPVHKAFTGVVDPARRALHAYAWLLEHAEAVLDHPGNFAALYADELAQVRHELDSGLRGAVTVQRFAELGFAVVTSAGPRHRLVLNTLAGAFRVLHVATASDGVRYRYHDRTESWFELATFHPLPRRDLRPLAERLAELEAEHDGARWFADPPHEPVPELCFGVPSPQAYGEITRELRLSHLPPERVVAAFASFFGRQGI